jgi:anti-sigma regulatory factor (Ser/Thr protein kinase)
MPDAGTAHGLRHSAVFYRGLAEFAAVLREFVRAGVASGEPVLVAVPRARSGVIADLDGSSGLIEFADMTELGRNPARIIPALRAFADRHAGHRVRFFGETVWPGRSEPEVCEAAKYEALVNLAFDGQDATIVCPYSSAELPPSVLTDAACTHPGVLSGGTELPSRSFAGRAALPARCSDPLSPPPADADSTSYESDIRQVRALVASTAARAGLTAGRVSDLVLAVSEIAANTLRYASGGGVVHAWHSATEVLCQVGDSGFIADPLAGLRKPPGDRPGGQGLWLVNQLCDLVELRTSRAGTMIRVHMNL